MIETAEQCASTDQVIPHILRRADDIERIIELVVTQVQHTREQLGADVPRSMHRLVLMNRLIHVGLAVVAEPSFGTHVNQGIQLRNVVAVCGRLLIECLAEFENIDCYRRRMKHDLNNSQYDTGLLIAFNRDECHASVTRVMSSESLH